MRHPRTRRRFYLMEPLERRYFFAIVAIDAVVGVPFDGLVATGLRLPDHATGLQAVNVFTHGQWDYTPTAVVRDDGTFDLYAHLIPQRGGTEPMTIYFRNDSTGGWDALEIGEQTIVSGHFNARLPDGSIYNRVPGTQMRSPVAIFEAAPLARPLEEYVVDVNWRGTAKSGWLGREDDGSVAAYVDDAFVPIEGDENFVTVTVRLKRASADTPVSGFARTIIASSVSHGVAIGTFTGWLAPDNTYQIDLPSVPKFQGALNYFVPAAESDGWESTFVVQVDWQNRGGDTATSSTAAIARNRDGSHRVVGVRPAGLEIEDGMIWIHETVHRPAIGGAPPQTYTVQYGGSFELTAGGPVGEQPPVIEPPAPELPDGGHGGVLPARGGGDHVVTALASTDLFSSRTIASISQSLFSSPSDFLMDDNDDEAAAADDAKAFVAELTG